MVTGGFVAAVAADWAAWVATAGAAVARGGTGCVAAAAVDGRVPFGAAAVEVAALAGAWVAEDNCDDEEEEEELQAAARATVIQRSAALRRGRTSTIASLPPWYAARARSDRFGGSRGWSGGTAVLQVEVAAERQQRDQP